jgi:hypothetical protein
MPSPSFAVRTSSLALVLSDRRCRVHSKCSGRNPDPPQRIAISLLKSNWRAAPESDIEPPRTPRAPSIRRAFPSGPSLCLRGATSDVGLLGQNSYFGSRGSATMSESDESNGLPDVKSQRNSTSASALALFVNGLVDHHRAPHGPPSWFLPQDRSSSKALNPARGRRSSLGDDNRVALCSVAVRGVAD